MTSKKILDLFEECKQYDPVTFFKRMGYRFQNEKTRAHSTYFTLMSQARISAEWDAYAKIMADQWDKQRADGTVANFWGRLPKNSSDKLARAQEDQAIFNVKRLYKRDNAMSKILDQGLLETARSNVAASSLSKKSGKPTDVSISVPSAKGLANRATQEAGQTKIDNMAGTPKPSTPAGTFSTGKHKMNACTAEEPWRPLTFAFMDIMDGKDVAAFPEPVPGMNRERALLFDHAVTSLKQYQDQDVQDKNVVLVKDAQVAMSFIFNTMSERACHHFEKFQEKELVETAKASSVIDGFDQHMCSTILKKYAPRLANCNVQKLMATLIIDRGSIFDKYSYQERLPASVELENKVLQILIIICEHILRPPFGKSSPSESDCLHVWMSIFSVMVDKLTIHTGERVLGSSRIMRKQQSAEFGDISESDPKVDMLFVYNGVEISNVKFKNPGSTERDLAIQNRENVRLARCIQEAHAALGVPDPSVLMADVAGFVGVIYQVGPLKGIAVTGETAHATVSLPLTRATLMAFLEDNSLAIIWNYVSRLEAQGQSVSDAKELHELALEKAKLERVKRGRDQSSHDSPQATVQIRFQDDVILTPSKKRVKILTIAHMKDLGESFPPPSPSYRDSL
ncbi:hypothetical protein KI688_001809 [Linnemannia hyalina]|uniref:Uncharacterized protein n=1 Tax=Linnemannia hyalina TaxID=64524 RepID=A0A9P7XTN3_9FUNG|nr:hypothetical protein KI688_001809 [Linnemannia hyalina]